MKSERDNVGHHRPPSEALKGSHDDALRSMFIVSVTLNCESAKITMPVI